MKNNPALQITVGPEKAIPLRFALLYQYRLTYQGTKLQ